MEKITIPKRPQFYSVSRHRWTKAAIECYKLGCVCHKCPTSKFVDGCRMKYSVIELIRTAGVPENLKYNERAILE